MLGTAITSALCLQLLLRVAGVRVGADVLHRVRHALHSARRVAAHLPQGLAHSCRGELVVRTAAVASGHCSSTANSVELLFLSCLS